MVRGTGLVQPGTARHDHRRLQVTDRLAAAGERRHAADPGADAGGHAGLWRISVVQRGQRPAGAWPLAADGDHPEPVVRGESLPRVRRGGQAEDITLLRLGRLRYGRTATDRKLVGMGK